MLEREHPGSIGLFLQGANGDVNSCVAHQIEGPSMLALDVIAARYARSVRDALTKAEPLEVESLDARIRTVTFGRKNWPVEKLREILHGDQAVIDAPGATDTDHNVRMASVRAISLRRMIAAMEAGRSLQPPTEVQGLRIGSVLLLGCPFETFQAVKNDVLAGVRSRPCLPMSITNDVLGYAVDRTIAAKGGYAADLAPLLVGQLPYVDIHGELVTAMVGLAKELETRG
jgi:hypothetical protein